MQPVHSFSIQLVALVTLPIISLANGVLTSCGFPPVASISSTTESQLLLSSTATEISQPIG